MNMTIKKGQIFYCPVCGVEVEVRTGGEEVAPLMCCDVDMLEIVKRKR